GGLGPRFEQLAVALAQLFVRKAKLLGAFLDGRHHVVSAPPSLLSSAGPDTAARAVMSPLETLFAVASSEDRGRRMERPTSTDTAPPSTSPTTPDVTRSQKA